MESQNAKVDNTGHYSVDILRLNGILYQLVLGFKDLSHAIQEF